MRARALALLALLALAVPAAAAGQVRLQKVDASRYPAIGVSVVTPKPARRAPTLTENGLPVAGLRAENLGRAKSVVLAVDRSQSMQGRPLRDAVTAARRFVAAKPRGDRIALVAFGSRALALTRFSSATIDADIALRDLSVDGRQGTALYDAVVAASKSLAAEPLLGRILIVLTDGDDTLRTTTLADAVAAAREAGVSVYPIAIAGPGLTRAPLRQLARETGGTYFEAASSRRLTQVYAQVARELRRTWRLEYMTAASPGEQLRLDARVPGFGVGRTTFAVPVSVGAVPTPEEPSPLVPSGLYDSALGTLMLSLTVALLVLLAVCFGSATRRGAWLRSRLEPHTAQAKTGSKSASKRESLALVASLLRATEQAFGHLRHWQAIARLLERADVPLRTVEFVYVMLGCGFVSGLVAAFTGSSPLIILAALGLGVLLPVGVLKFKARRRTKTFEDQLPDLLVTLAASLKAGHSFKQGIQAVVDEGMEPASKEFKRVLTETSLGRPMDDALGEVAGRVGSKNLEFVMTAVTIQRQVGGSLASLFDMVADTVRQRQQFARKIRSLTAMGRAAAYVLVGLPFFVAAAITVLNPEYMDPLYHSSAGHKLIIIGLVSMAFGSLLLKRIVSFRG